MSEEQRSFTLIMTPYLLSEPDERRWPVTTERDPSTGLFEAGCGCFDECCNIICRRSRGMPCLDAAGHVIAPCPRRPAHCFAEQQHSKQSLGGMMLIRPGVKKK